jgi:hypothetical protein
MIPWVSALMASATVISRTFHMCALCDVGSSVPDEYFIDYLLLTGQEHTSLDILA